MSELIDNRAQRIATLKNVILHLHRGGRPEEVRQRLQELVQNVDASEIAAMEQQLMSEGMSVDEVRSMCDLHAEVMRDVMSPIQIRPSIGPGHPVETFQRENDAILSTLAELRTALEVFAAAPDGHARTTAHEQARGLTNTLFDIEKHYRRKEEVLFPLLERHGITGPSKVMWAKDDEARGALTAFADRLAHETGDRAAWWADVRAAFADAALAIEGMVDKETRILLPMALDTLTRDEWGLVWHDSPRIGWCIVEPRTGYVPPDATRPTDVVAAPGTHAIPLPAGHVTIAQLGAILYTLPLDLTFVDADDRVAFYSEGPERVFSRSKAVIGRKVQHCHPPRSVSIVDQILEDFRSGRQSSAEFWIEMQGRFLHIRYFAVRDDSQTYLGCLEVTQDVTRIRALRGERRLLAYGTDEPDTERRAPRPSRAGDDAAPQQPRVESAVTQAASAAPGIDSHPHAATIVQTIDADVMLAQGVHPLQLVQDSAANLLVGHAIAVDSGFLPKPLIDVLVQAGYNVSSGKAPDGRYRTIVAKR